MRSVGNSVAAIQSRLEFKPVQEASGARASVRISAKRQTAPLVLSSEQVKQGLAVLQFRDQLLVFLIGALGTRRGEVGALRWTDCDFTNQTLALASHSAVAGEVTYGI